MAHFERRPIPSLFFLPQKPSIPPFSLGNRPLTFARQWNSRQPHPHRPLPQPIALALRDPEFPRHLVRVQSRLEQRGHAFELAEMERPPAPARDADAVG